MKKLTEQEIKQKVWWMMYDLALQEPDYLKGMIVKVTDPWDKEQFKISYKHMKAKK